MGAVERGNRWRTVAAGREAHGEGLDRRGRVDAPARGAGARARRHGHGNGHGHAGAARAASGMQGSRNRRTRTRTCASRRPPQRIAACARRPVSGLGEGRRSGLTCTDIASTFPGRGPVAAADGSRAVAPMRVVSLADRCGGSAGFTPASRFTLMHRTSLRRASRTPVAAASVAQGCDGMPGQWRDIASRKDARPHRPAYSASCTPDPDLRVPAG